MLQITRQTEYAIRGLQDLARRNGDGPVQLKLIAGSCQVSEAFLAKIFQMLAQGEGTFQDRARRLGDETDSTHVREIVDFVLGDTDRSFLTPN